MKPVAITFTLVLLGVVTANAQLSFLPQVGFDQSKTSVSVNDLPSVSPMGFASNFKANLRMDYRFKKGHGPYVGIGTAPGAMAYSFSDITNAATNFTASANPWQLRLESGYQYSSKPINLTKTSKKQTAQTTTQKTQTKYRCGSYSYSRQHRTATTVAAKPQDNLTLRLQPSVGVAYLPSVKNDMVTTASGYQYNAGNYKTSMVSTMGFEFGKGTQRLFTLSVFYTKGLGKLDEQSVTNIESEKVSATLNSKSSAWGMMVGVPFSFAKQKKLIAPAKITAPTQQHKEYYKSRCGAYRSGSCIRKI